MACVEMSSAVLTLALCVQRVDLEGAYLVEIIGNELCTLNFMHKLLHLVFSDFFIEL